MSEVAAGEPAPRPWPGARAGWGTGACGARGSLRRPRPTTTSKRRRASPPPCGARRRRPPPPRARARAGRPRPPPGGAARRPGPAARRPRRPAAGRPPRRAPPRTRSGSGSPSAPGAGRPAGAGGSRARAFPVTPAAAGLLARDGRRRRPSTRGAVAGQPPGQERPRGAAAPRSRRSRAVLLARRPAPPPGSAVAVPSLPTTTPAAQFASRAASSRDAPAARARPRVAMTVSPAPVTSKTSRAAVAMWSGRPSRLEQAQAVLAPRDEGGRRSGAS